MTKFRTLILGLAVLLITFSIFVGLPAILPPLTEVDCDAFWCRAEVIEYETWFWDKPEQPDLPALVDNLRFEPVEIGGILNGLKLISFEGPTGKLSITEDPENENRVIVSGYLQYGTVMISENASDSAPSRIPVLHGYRTRTAVVIYFTDMIQDDTGNRYRGRTFYKTTDETGHFSLAVEPQGYCFWIQAEYEGELLYNRNPKIFYYPCKVSYSTCEPGEYRKGFPWWIVVVIGLVLAVVTWLVYRYLKNRTKAVLFSEKQPQVEEIPSDDGRKKEQPEYGGDTSMIAIVFTDIEESLPAVWEANMTLKVYILVRDRSGKNLNVPVGDMDFGDGETKQVVSDEKGTIPVSHIYLRKGDYLLRAGYKDQSGDGFTSWRKIRIVDYREEIVRLFGEMLEKLNLADIHIKPDMTPREVERLLIEKLKGVSKENIRQVIDGFEEANYSTHPLNRESYVRMYKAIEKIIHRSD